MPRLFNSIMVCQILPAIRMVSPGTDQVQKSIGFKPIDTLDADPGRPPEPPRRSPPPAHAPAPKRQKQVSTEGRPRGPAEDIVDSDADVTSRTENHGSQASFAHSVSPGISEYQAVEASSGRGRSNRRRRQSPGHPLHSVPGLPKRGRARGEPIEDFDELAPQPRPPLHRQRVARLTMPSVADVEAARSPRINFGDAADNEILGKRSRRERNLTYSARSKKRASHEITDGDELADDADGRDASKTNARPMTVDSTRHHPPSPSLSRKGNMNRTNWAKKADTFPDTGVLVVSAVCQPNFRYLPARGQKPCHLRRLTLDPELRAFTDDGHEAEPYQWLRITKRVKSLSYHPESNFIKIHQTMDQSSSIGPIGGMMVLKFRNHSDASWVTDWVRENLKIPCIQERERYGSPTGLGASRTLLTTFSHKLLQIYDKMSQDISQAPTRLEARRLPHETPVHPPRLTLDTTGVERKDRPPSSARTPIRNQMQVSAPTPSFSRVESTNGLVISGSRSLRSRQVGGQVLGIEAPRSPLIRRWTEENPDWAKNWKMPLMFHRTTVDKEDIPRLDEGECLNDNLIGFGLRYLFDEFASRHPDLNKRVYLHNSFFYEKLKSSRGTINYDGVKSWTAKVDLLSYDYIIVPVNEHFHWWVAIICNPGRLDPDSRKLPSNAESVSRKEGTTKGPETRKNTQDGASSDVEMTDVTENLPMQPSRADTTGEERGPDPVKSDIVDLSSDDRNGGIDLTHTGAKYGRKSGPSSRRYNPEDPRIITLDSLGSSHSHTVTHLKKYLLEEFKHKRNKIITEVPQQLGMKAVGIPEQNNFCDCGVYLLGYIQEFVKNPDLFIHTLLRKESPNWEFDPRHLRELWRETIQCEHKKYQDKQEAMQKKREASAAKGTPNADTEPNSHQSRATSEVGDKSKGKCDGRTGCSEQPASAKGASSPTVIHEVADSDADEDPHSRQQKANEETRSPVPARSGSSHQRTSQQDNPDEVVLLSTTQDAILPSIEPPDMEELSGRQDEPMFISKLATSPLRPQDPNHIAEVHPSSFYSSNSVKAEKVSGRPSQMSSPGVGQRATVDKTQPARIHAESRFVLGGSDIPVVQKAELVRQSDTIDLTD
ncbi:Ubiquitin-like protease family profile domain-containing protein [Madurella fahalii]|uniref:Ubiquitin-like protease family profile domain-containing protein n=1 Tax=Madurella fahalii TaxID=1157608 RepID=A0ABQ0G8Y6_9PEZI